VKCPTLLIILLLLAGESLAQTEGARISGRVTDPTDAVIVGAECEVLDIETGVSTVTPTNDD